MHGNEIIGRSVLDGKTGTLMGIGIETAEEYKRQGIAATLAAEVVNQITAVGLIPYWECTDDNIGSYKTAEKCGFTQEFSYRLLGFAL